MSARVSKDYEQKQGEILSAGAELFNELGYDGTSVDAILKRAGISKGTFYHYFESKEGLLDAIVDQLTDYIINEARSKIDNAELNAVEKLNLYYETATHQKAKKRDTLMMLMNAMHSEDNARLHLKVLQRTMPKQVEILSVIITEGVEQKLFNVENPKLTAEMLVYMGLGVQQHNAAVLATSGLQGGWDEIIKNTQCYFQTLERILQASPGSIKIASTSLKDFKSKWVEGEDNE